MFCLLVSFLSTWMFLLFLYNNEFHVKSNIICNLFATNQNRLTVDIFIMINYFAALEDNLLFIFISCISLSIALKQSNCYYLPILHKELEYSPSKATQILTLLTRCLSIDIKLLNLFLSKCRIKYLPN